MKKNIFIFLNRKGGVGKSTLVSNFVVALARKKYSLAVFSQDECSSLSYWVEKRASLSADSSADLSAASYQEDITYYSSQKLCMRSTHSFKHHNALKKDFVIFDTEKNVSILDFKHLRSHQINFVLPFYLSELDILVMKRLIDEIRINQSFFDKVNILSILNRVDLNEMGSVTSCLDMLDVPCIAYLENDTAYTKLFDSGQSIFDFPEEYYRLRGGWSSLIRFAENEFSRVTNYSNTQLSSSCLRELA